MTAFGAVARDANIGRVHLPPQIAAIEVAEHHHQPTSMVSSSTSNRRR